ncbi:MAG: hypothetical protein CL915_00275 [Deltaproteobacteria bacterium]|nr:hypothetical protein [Deltaproteobacteria bacterium]
MNSLNRFFASSEQQTVPSLVDFSVSENNQLKINLSLGPPKWDSGLPVSSSQVMIRFFSKRYDWKLQMLEG